MAAKKRSLIQVTFLLTAVAAALVWGLGRTQAQAANPVAGASARAQGGSTSGTTPPLCDLSKPPSLGAIATAIAPTGKAFVSDYNLLSQASWCTLIALTWPAQGTAPTMTADPSQKFGASGATEVWETWQDSTEVYCANGMPPGQCGTTLAQTAGSRKVHRLKAANPNTSHFFPATKLKALAARVKKGRSPHLLGLAASEGDDQDLSENVQATGFMLPDKNNTPSNNSIILYEVRENPDFVTYLTQQALYNRNGQTTLYNNQGGKPLPPGQTPIDFPPGAFEVKPGWYVIPGTEQQPMYTSQGTCSPGVQCGTNGTVNIGMTSFHVLWKVFPKSTWIWMTFEYNNNPTLTPILSKQVCYTRPSGESCPNSAATCATVSASCCNGSKNASLCVDGPYNPAAPAPTDPVVNAANAANAIYQPMLAGTPFANYKLVGVQVAFVINGQPTLLANNHVETDFGATNTLTNPTSSCITCHYYASIGNLNTGNCTKSPPKPANIRRIGIFQTTTAIPNMQAFGTGYTGNGDAGHYSANGSSGPYVAGDFIWTLQLSQWNLAQGNGCPTTASATKSKKPAVKPKPVKKPAKPTTTSGR